MADNSSRRLMQYGHASNTLNYGHLGTSTYREDTHTWNFYRYTANTTENTEGASKDDSIKSAFPFRPVDDQVEVVFKDSGSQIGNVDNIRHIPSSYKNFFLKFFPDIVPTLGHIEDHYIVPSVSNTSARGYDPNCSERLDFGYAAILSEKDKAGKHGDRDYAAIAAFATGLNAESVKFVRMDRKRIVTRDKGLGSETLRVPGISDQDEAWWTGSGEPVQQISFAATFGVSSTWLAIRQESCTTILHPLLHRRPVPSRHSFGGSAKVHHPASCLDANPALVIPISRTGGYPQADVAFHPFNHHTLAIVDEHGNWSIWHVEDTPRLDTRSFFRTSLQCSGKLYPTPREIALGRRNPYHDGWHRIRWLENSDHDVDGILVSNRQCSRTYDLSGELSGEVSMQLGSAHEQQWILDIKENNLHRSHFFVLTSTRLLLMSTGDENHLGQIHTKPVTLLCSWQHFRSRKDHTMRIALLELHQSTVVLVYSQTNSFATFFRMGSGSEGSSMLGSLADPVAIELPQNTHSPGGFTHSNVVLREIEVDRSGSKDLELPYMKLFVQGADLRIMEMLYQCNEPGQRTTLATPSSTAIHLPHKQSLRVRSSKYAELGEVADFVVPDGEEVSLELSPYLVMASGDQVESLDRSDAVQIVQTQSIDLENLYNTVFEQPPTAERHNLIDELQEFDDNKQFGRSNVNFLFMKDILPGDLHISDVDEASLALQEFLEGLPRISDSKFSTRLLQTQESRWHSSETILDHYNSMLSTWVASLGPEVPDRVRVNRERLIRRVALDIVLSTVTLRRRPPHTENDQGRAASEPAFRNSRFEDVSILASQSVPSHTPTRGDDPACDRLRSLTTLSKPMRPLDPSAMTSGLLDHLPTDISVDPSTYSWRTIEQAQAARRDEEMLEKDPRTRHWAEKRAEIQRRRFESQKQMSQQVLMDRDVPMVVGTDIMSRLPVREVQSSQVGPQGSQEAEGGGAVTMTQPLRGTFGTRTKPKRKDKGTRRVAGF